MSAFGALRLHSALLLGALSATSCTLALQREHDQCHTSADCQSRALGAVCTENGVCERLLETQRQPKQTQSCELDADCTDDDWSVCHDGTCQSLAIGSCIRLGEGGRNGTRERLPLAVLVPSAELSQPSDAPNLLAASFAIAELQQALVDPPASSRCDPFPQCDPLPQIVAVACDEDDSAGYAALTDAGVHLLIGPMRAGAVDNARAAADGHAVLFSPYADAPNLYTPRSSPTSSIVSCKPNRSDSKASLLSATRFMHDRLVAQSLMAKDGKPLLALSETERDLGYDQLEDGSLEAVVYADPPVAGLVSQIQAADAAPGFLVAGSAVEDWSEVIGSLEQSAAFAKRQYPLSYLLADKQASVLGYFGQAISSDDPPEQRTFGLDSVVSDENRAIHQSFGDAFWTTTGRPLEPGLDYVRDCVYLATYAAVAGQLRLSLAAGQLSPVAVLVGLRALTGKGRPLRVGPEDIKTVLSELQKNHDFDASVTLIGGSGDLDLLGVLSVAEIEAAPTAQYVRPSARDQQLYCVDSTLAFYDMDVVFPVSGDAPSLTDSVSCGPAVGL